jgi:surface antigen
MNKYSIIFLLCCATIVGHAANGSCLITLNKSKCWTNFSVTVKVIDTSKNTLLGTIVVNKGQNQAQQKISCASNQTLQYSATFSPVIWREDKDKIYYSKQYIQIPEGENWELNINFPDAFSELPDPIDGGC